MRKDAFPADAGYRFQRFGGLRKETRTRQAFLQDRGGTRGHLSMAYAFMFSGSSFVLPSCLRCSGYALFVRGYHKGRSPGSLPLRLSFSSTWPPESPSWRPGFRRFSRYLSRGRTQSLYLQMTRKSLFGRLDLCFPIQSFARGFLNVPARMRLSTRGRRESRG